MKRFFLIILIFNNLSIFSQEKNHTFLFDFNKYSLPDSSLIFIAKLFKNNNIDRILLEGHCDSVGSRSYNLNLSQNRANEIKKLLLQNGLNKSNIKTCIGFGKEKPLNKNLSENERQLNRRVEMTIYEKDKILIEEQKPKSNSIKIIKKEDLKVGNQIVLDKLLFIPGKHVVVHTSENSLKNLLQILE